MRDVGPMLALRPQGFQFADDTYSGSGSRFASRRPFTDAEEMELALELLGVTSDAELEEFLGKFFKKIGRGLKKGFKSVGRFLKKVAKKALPFLATAAGTFFGGPAGGAIAGKLGSLVSKALEVEAEAAGSAAADRDLEKCRQFVRMAGQAAMAAAAAPPGVNPVAVAQKVMAESARKTLATKTLATPAAWPSKATPNGKASAGLQAAARPSATLKKVETGSPAAATRRCAGCGKSVGGCSCGSGKPGDGGGWVRCGRTIIVNY